jgi:hypothetical protein
MDEKEREELNRRRDLLNNKNDERKLQKKREAEEKEKKFRQLKDIEMEKKQKSKEKSEKIYSEWCSEKKAAEELKKLQIKEVCHNISNF